MASPRIALRPPKSVPSPESDQKDAPIRNRIGTLSPEAANPRIFGRGYVIYVAMSKSPTEQPVVEQTPGNKPAADITERSLRLRIRQQEILAELGVLALQGPKFTDLLNQTARLTADGLDAEYCKVLEYLPAENRLLVRAGVGWHEGVVGQASVGADLASPGGFALRTGKPVISNHLENEERFRTPELLVEHGIRRAMNVILQGDGLPFGVLEVDSRSEGEFSEHDIAFLQGAANILGMAIEQQRSQQKAASRPRPSSGSAQGGQSSGQEQPPGGCQHAPVAGSRGRGSRTQ